MNNVLITGATSFLGYHVTKRLNDQGIRPRVLELLESKHNTLAKLDVNDARPSRRPAALGAACKDVDTLLHVAFKVIVGGGAKPSEMMHGSTSQAAPSVGGGVRKASPGLW